MHGSDESPFFSLGEWLVRPDQRSIERRGERVVLEPKLIDVLTYLAGHAGAVISSEQLLTDCWRGTFYGDNPVHKTMALLRKALRDDARSPRYIATVRKRGYQLIADVAFPDERARGPSARHTWTQGSPFRGLSPFDIDHAAVFFGRSRATADLLAMLHRQHRAGASFVLVTGPSGSGKSSLVQAGVLPALMREAGYEGLRAVAATGFGCRSTGAPLIEALSAAMTGWTIGDRPVFVDVERALLARALIDDLPWVLDRIAKARVRAPGAALENVLVLVVETLEALVTAPIPAPAECTALFTALAWLARSGHVLVLALCRNDFYPQLMAVTELLALKQSGGLYDVPMPTPGEVAQMIRLPAVAAGLSFEREPAGERELDDVLLDAACRRAGSLPLLQYALQSLYDLRDPHGRLTFAAYAELGGLEGALARRAEQTFGQLDAGAVARLPEVLQRLVSLSSDGDEVTAQVVHLEGLDDPAARRLVQHLVDARLFVGMLDRGVPCFTVAHEALLRHWPRVVAWVEAHRATLRSRARIAEMARRWAREGHRRDQLLPRGALLAEARTLYRRAALDDDERWFIRRSLRRTRIGMGILLSMAMAIVGLAAVSSFAAVDARHARLVADARRGDAEDMLDFMLGDMHERLSALGRLDLLDAVTGRAMSILGRNAQDDAPGALLRQARALRQIGEIRFTRGDIDGAQPAFAAAGVRLDRVLADDPRQAAAYAERGKIAFWRAQIASAHGHAAEATQSWLAYLADAERRAALEPDEPDAWLELSYANNCLGTAALQAERLTEASARFDASIALKRRVLAKRPGDHATWLDLADTLSWRARSAQQAGDLRTVLDVLRGERDAVARARQPGPPSATWQYRSGLSFLHVAKAEADLGLVDLAAADYASGAATFVTLVGIEPDNRNWQRDLAYTRLQQGWLAYSIGQSDLALGHLLEAERMIVHLLSVDGHVADWHALLALDRNNQALVLLQQGRVARAGTVLAGAWEHLAEPKGPKTTVAEAGLRATLDITAGEVARAAGDRETSTVHWRRVVDGLASRVSTSADTRLLDPYVRASLLLGLQGEVAPYLERLRRSGYRPPTFESYVTLALSRNRIP